MAKRRKLSAPSSADIERMEQEFRGETPRSGALAPIAQVAAEAALATNVVGPEERALQAKNKADAEAFQAAIGQGRLIEEVALADIETDTIARDRMEINEADQEELRQSIAANGLRLPIEVYPLKDPRDGKRYGLISGYRRFLAVSALNARTGGERFAAIKALVRDPKSIADTLAAMVEENEVRADLSQFERGRIAVLAAQNDTFTNVEEAVDTLFAYASKAKRSKIRSFALIFEELGDVLKFPQALTEKLGLRIAAALRGGADTALREALAAFEPDGPESEKGFLLRALDTLDLAERDPSRGGRPSRSAAAQGGVRRETGSGFRISHSFEKGANVIRIKGDLHPELVDSLMDQIAYWLEAP